mgnify:FL=1
MGYLVAPVYTAATHYVIKGQPTDPITSLPGFYDTNVVTNANLSTITSGCGELIVSRDES